MNIYAAERQTGKTTMLVKESAKTGAIIVTPTYQMRNYIIGLANHLNINIPDPITVDQYIKILVYGSLGKSQKYLVDELQMMLSQMNIETATVNMDNIEVMEPSVDCCYSRVFSVWKWVKKYREGE